MRWHAGRYVISGTGRGGGMEMRNILVPVDGSANSSRGLDCAIYLARQCGGRITAVYARHAPASHALHPLGFVGAADREGERRALGAARARAARRGVELRGRALPGGDPAREITRFANSHRPAFDAVVVGARGRGSARAAFFGSVSNHIVHGCRMPVVVVK